MSFKPLGDRVAIEPLQEAEKTAGGIFIPDTAKEKPTKGRVVSVGEGARNSEGDVIPLNVQVGDTVMYAKWGGTELKVGNQEIIIVKESDILGIVTE